MKAVMCAMLLFGSAGTAAAACVPDIGSVTYAQTVTVPFVQAPDVRLHIANSQGIRFQCDVDEDMALRARMSGLTYVRDINGGPAYELSPDSPLVVITFMSDNYDGGESLENYVDAFGANPWYVYPGRSEMWAILEFYSRGGPMRPQMQRSLGSVLIDGASTSAEFHFSIGYDFRGTTCALSAAPVVLDPIAANQLDSASTGGDKAFDVLMDCGVPGRPVSLQIHDATDRSNMTDVLEAAAGSDATGVGLQILHQGAPLMMGRAWAHSDSTGSTERIPFSARYLRLPSEPLQSGAIIGEAVLLADYY